MHRLLPPLLCALFCLTATAEKPAWQRAIDATLDGKKITVDFTQTPFGDVLMFVQQVSGIINLVVDPQTKLSGKLVTLKLQNVTLRTMLQRLIATQKAQMGCRLGVLLISTPARLKMVPHDVQPQVKEGGPPVDKQSWLQMQRKVTLDFTGTPLADVTQFLQETTGQNMVLDQALYHDKYKVDLQVNQITVLRAFTLITALLGAEISFEHGVCRIKRRPRSCAGCKKPLQGGWRFCPDCGKQAPH